MNGEEVATEERARLHVHKDDRFRDMPPSNFRPDSTGWMCVRLVGADSSVKDAEKRKKTAPRNFRNSKNTAFPLLKVRNDRELILQKSKVTKQPANVAATLK